MAFSISKFLKNDNNAKISSCENYYFYSIMHVVRFVFLNKFGKKISGTLYQGRIQVWADPAPAPAPSFDSQIMQIQPFFGLYQPFGPLFIQFRYSAPSFYKSCIRPCLIYLQFFQVSICLKVYFCPDNVMTTPFIIIIS